MKRVFLIVLDSVGIGEMPDAAEYHDEGSNTLLAASRSPYFPCQICAHWAILILTESTLEEKKQIRKVHLPD